jgi:hypothetical protein
VAHLRFRVGSVLEMHQAAVLDGFALDEHAFQQSVLSPAEIDISRGQVVQDLVISAMVIWTRRVFFAAPTARLGCLAFESQGAFAS